MQVAKINYSDKSFTGKIIYPEFMTPEIEKFKGFAHDRITKIIEDKPFDIYVRSKKTGDKVFVEIKPTGEEKEINQFLFFILYDAVKTAKDKMLLQEIKELFVKFEVPKIVEEIPLMENFSRKDFIPRKIGRNNEISSRSKYYKNGTKYIKRGG